MFEKKKYLVTFHNTDGSEKQLFVYALNTHKAEYKVYKTLAEDGFFAAYPSFDMFMQNYHISTKQM